MLGLLSLLKRPTVFFIFSFYSTIYFLTLLLLHLHNTHIAYCLASFKFIHFIAFYRQPSIYLYDVCVFAFSSISFFILLLFFVCFHIVPTFPMPIFTFLLFSPKCINTCKTTTTTMYYILHKHINVMYVERTHSKTHRILPFIHIVQHFCKMNAMRNMCLRNYRFLYLHITNIIIHM